MKLTRLTGITGAVILVLAATAVCRAAEHPREHPQARPAEPARPSAEEQLKMDFSKTVEDHIKMASEKTEGDFVVHDDVLNKDWKLKLDKIHTDKIVKLAEDRFFACADFTSGDDKLDLDFYAGKGKDGWAVNEVLIHKVNGAPRFTYNDKNERVPVTQEAMPEKAPDENK